MSFESVECGVWNSLNYGYRTSHAIRHEEALFPLTPALSLGEREKCSPFSGDMRCTYRLEPLQLSLRRRVSKNELPAK